jgi:hypothetical protein
MVMDVVFDIDGTLANAKHRLHHIIPDPNAIYEQPFKKDWDKFLSDELVAKDEPIEQMWDTLYALMQDGHRVIFITGRPEAQRKVTYNWLYDETMNCPIRAHCSAYWKLRAQRNGTPGPVIYMRKKGDRRLSHIVKGELLDQARWDGFNPKLAFEDRIEDTKMWREKGLLCCQVAEGNY